MTSARNAQRLSPGMQNVRPLWVRANQLLERQLGDHLAQPHGADTKGERLHDWTYLEPVDLEDAGYDERLSGL